MIILLLFIVLILSLVCYLLLAPFYIEVDTTKDLYRLRFHRLASVSLILMEEPVLLIKIAGWKKEISMLDKHLTNVPVNANDKASFRRKNNTLSYQDIKYLLKSFKVETFYLDMDFEDMAINGILFPCFHWLSWYSQKYVHINFRGNTVLTIVVKNSIARMGWALISSKLRTNPS